MSKLVGQHLKLPIVYLPIASQYALRVLFRNFSFVSIKSENSLSWPDGIPIGKYHDENETGKVTVLLASFANPHCYLAKSNQ